MSLFKADVVKKRQSALNSTAKKRLLDRIASEFLQPSADDLSANFDSAVSLMSVVVHGQRSVNVYVVDKVPMIFEHEETIFPTVYFLHKFPGAVLSFSVTQDVHDAIVRGADLYLPALALNEENESTFGVFPKHKPCSIIVENSLFPFAVGITLMSSNELKSSSRGKVVKVLHMYHDYLWKIGPQLSETAESVCISTKQLENLILHSDNGNNDDSDETRVQMGNDELFRLVALTALKSVRTEDLPLLANVFYGSTVLRLFPECRRVSVKDTKYKKFSTFLQQLEDEELIEISRNKGVEQIVAIFKDRDAFKRLPKLPTAAADEEAKAVRATRPDVTELFTVTEPLLSLVKCVAKDFDKNTRSSMADIRRHVTTYVGAMELKLSNAVRIDKRLGRCLGKDYATGSVIRWPDLFDKLNGHVRPIHELRFVDGFVERRKGKIRNIELRTEKRRGNKTVTLVNNVQQHHIDPTEFMKLIQPTVCGSATVNKGVANCEGPQIQIQGDHCNRIKNVLIEKYAVKPKFIQIV